MRKPEQIFYGGIKRALKNSIFGPNTWTQRIENSVGDGIPDTYWKMKGGKSFWVELKIAKFPKRSSSIVFKKDSIRQSQINWHLKYHSMGGISFIFARIDAELFLFYGKDADKLRGATANDLCRLRVPISTYDLIFFHWSKM